MVGWCMVLIMDRRSLLVLAATLPFAGSVPAQETPLPCDKVISSIFYARRSDLYRAAHRALDTLDFKCWGAFTCKHESRNRFGYAFLHPGGTTILETFYEYEVHHNKSMEDLLLAFEHFEVKSNTLISQDYIITSKFDSNLLDNIHANSAYWDLDFKESYIGKQIWDEKTCALLNNNEPVQERVLALRNKKA
jgi:hypothetical protein